MLNSTTQCIKECIETKLLIKKANFSADGLSLHVFVFHYMLFLLL